MRQSDFCSLTLHVGGPGCTLSLFSLLPAAYCSSPCACLGATVLVLVLVHSAVYVLVCVCLFLCTVLHRCLCVLQVFLCVCACACLAVLRVQCACVCANMFCACWHFLESLLCFVLVNIGEQCTFASMLPLMFGVS